MTVDEAIKQIIDSLIGEKAYLLNHSDRVALTDALNIMRKYQKIEQIANDKNINGDFDYWIPVCKMLPPDNKHVLLYLEKECAYDYPNTMIDWWVQEGFYNREYGFYVCDSPDIGRGIKDDYVRAWTALPQPYKGDIDGLG